MRFLIAILLAAAFQDGLQAQATVYLRYGGPFTRKTITSIRPGTPALVTSPKHGFVNGDRIAIQAVSGMPSVTGIRIVTNATEDTFEITDLAGQPVEARGLWENKGWAGKVRETKLAGHPRGLLDGPNGKLTARVKDPDGGGGQKSPAAKTGWVPWDSLIRRYEAATLNPQAGLLNKDVNSGHGIFATSLVWFADNSRTRYRDAAKYWLNNLEQTLAYTPESSFFGACREDGGFCGTYTGSTLLWTGFYLAEAAQAYSVMRDQMSPAERKALADKMLNGLWDEQCTNRLKLGEGTVESVKGSNKLKGEGTQFKKLPNPVGRWIQLRDGFKPYESWYKIVSVESDTELTLDGPANVSIASVGWFWEDDWKEGTCGAVWKMAHHATMSNVVARIGNTTLRQAVTPDDDRLVVNNPWAFAQQPPFYVRAGTEWMKVVERTAEGLKVERAQFFTTRTSIRANVTVSSADFPTGGSNTLLAYRAPPGFPDFDGVLDNKNHVFLYGLLTVSLAFADDDSRARDLFEATWNYWHDFSTYDQMAMGTGITRGGFSYFPFWTAFAHEMVAIGRNSLQPAIDLSEGNWLRKSQLYPIYGSLPWAPRDTVMFADSGSDPRMPLRHFRYFPVGLELFPNTGESRYSTFFYQNGMKYWDPALMGSRSEGFDISTRWLIYSTPGLTCPSQDCVDYKTLEPFYFFTETDNGGKAPPENAYNAVVSKQDWSDKATIVWMSAFGAPGDHLGVYSTPGAYRIGKAGVWLHASGKYTLDSSNTKLGSYVEVDTPTSLALPASNRRNTLGTLGPVVLVDQKLGNRSAVYWRVNTNHAFQTSAAIRHSYRYFTHFTGPNDYLVVYDSVATASEKLKQRRVYCYTGDLAAGKSGDVYKRSGSDITCSRPEATLLTRVLLPAAASKLTDEADGTNSRFTLINDGQTSDSDFLVVHYPVAGPSGTMPATQAVSSDDGAFRGVWIQDQTPRLALYARTPQPPGSFSFTVPFQGEGQVVIGGLGSGKYSVTLNGAPLAGEFSVRPGDGALSFNARGGKVVVTLTGAVVALAIVPGTPPAAVTGKSYRNPLLALGGVPPYTWELVSGSLPQGLSLDANGVIAGVAEREETTEFRVRVTDRSQPPESVEETFQLTAADPPPEPLSIFIDTIETTAVGLRYGKSQLPESQSCNVTLALDSQFEIVVDDFFDYGGPPFRDLTFGWNIPLIPGTPYYLRARCGEDLAITEFETTEEDNPSALAPAAPPPVR